MVCASFIARKGSTEELSVRNHFIDPPRSGLDSETEKMVQAHPRILYISCNPETL